MLKRNDVVVSASSNKHFDFYGRVTRILDEDRVEVIDCGKHVTIGPQAAFTAVSYKGHHDYLRPSLFRPMPSLRKLKQMAARYDKTVWKRHRTKSADRPA